VRQRFTWRFYINQPIPQKIKEFEVVSRYEKLVTIAKRGPYKRNRIK
jgi:hypothetical protein